MTPETYKKGDVIGDMYEVLGTLGKGGFGVVYLVHLRETGQSFALKTFHDEWMVDSAARQAFKKEALVWVNLETHPCILAARWVEEVSGRLFVQMEYIAADVQGRVTLADHLARAKKALDTNQTLVWAIQFCLGMEHAVAHGVDSVAFELITAARYAVLSAIDHIEFIDEQPPKKTPDIFLSLSGAVSFVECKKLVRVKDFSVTTRSTVRDIFNGVISSFREQGISVLAEVAFNCDPQRVGQSSLLAACRAALHDRTTIISPQFTVKATRLPKYESREYTLDPSPLFFSVRYGYRLRSEWFGIVHQLFGKPARLANLPKDLQGGVSTWLDTVEWDAAIKWKISAEDVVAKYRRFGFDGLFHAIEQINSAGLNSSVHLWLETDHFIGGRREALLDFFKRLSANAGHTIAWIVINETLLDISPKGRFDLIEHAHMIQGPTATTPHPLVSAVFAQCSPSPTTGEFGVGNKIPDIDED